MMETSEIEAVGLLRDDPSVPGVNDGGVVVVDGDVALGAGAGQNRQDQ